MTRHFLVIGVLAGAILAFASVAAAGGPQPSSASDLPIGQTITDSGDGGYSMWKLNLGAGDTAVIDWSGPSDNGAALCIQPGSVTDFTYAQTSCLKIYSIRADQKDEVSFDAGSGGSYLLIFGCGECFGTPRSPPPPPGSYYSFGYTMNLRVVHATTLSFSSATNVGSPGASIVFRGRLSGQQLAPGSKVAIQGWTGKAWKTAALLTTKADGSFAYPTHAAKRPARYLLRAVFFGDAAHKPSTATFTFRVV